MTNRFARLLSSASIVFVTLASAQAAFAQTATPEEQAAAETGDAASADDIVVTGSRITRSGFTAPTPTTVVGETDLARVGASNVATLLNQLPAFRATTSSTTGTLTTSSGANYLDLRGLGITRTLTLVDGQRFVPNNITGQVDLNLIPSLLIERTDIVTGGASAAYGSDAVAGVVNLIFKKRVEGIEGSVQYGVSSRGDNRELSVGLLAGTSFADGRGHVMVGGQYVDNKGVGAMTTREWGRNAVQLISNPLFAAGNGQPTRIIVGNVHPSAATNGGLINTPGLLRGIQFGPGGTTSQFNYGNPVGPTWMIGGDGTSLADYQQLSTPVERASAYGRLSYEITPDIEVAASFFWGRSHTVGTGGVTFEPAIKVFSDNAYIPASVKSVLTANSITDFTIGRIGKDYSEDRNRSYFLNDNLNNVYRGVLSIAGKLGDWKWSAYYEHGESIYTQYTYNQRIEANWQRAIDAVFNPANPTQIVCRSTLTNPGDGCVPFDIFGQYSASPEARAYIRGTIYSRLHFIEDVGAASISGEPFSTWAGPVSVAAGVEFRSDRASSEVDAISAANGFYSGNPKSIRGTYSVKEGFVETVVPLLADKPLARSLELNAAVRYADYSVSGGVASWKVGLNYKPTENLRFRVTRSRDVRAPNLNELYTQGTNAVAQIIDPTNSTQGNAIISQRGSVALTPERANTLTLGVVYEPQWAPGLRLSVDGYDISVEGVITTLGAQDTVNRCAAGATNLCQYVIRNGANTITSVLTPFLNLASLKTRGIDFEAAYRTRLGNSGALSLRLLATYVDRLTTDDGAIKIDVAGETGGFRVGGVPHWSATGIATYENGPFSVSGQLRYIGPGVYDATATAATINDNRIPARLYTQLSGSYTILRSANDRKLELYGVIDNLFDVDPPAAPNATQSFTNAALFDVIGRSFKFGLRFKY
jgi:outer membrane receptor protein involved in Fe transport